MISKYKIKAISTAEFQSFTPKKSDCLLHVNYEHSLMKYATS